MWLCPRQRGEPDEGERLETSSHFSFFFQIPCRQGPPEGQNTTRPRDVRSERVYNSCEKTNAVSSETVNNMFSIL
jgi:hypothetical protein